MKRAIVLPGKGRCMRIFRTKDILMEDSDLLVVQKHAGMAVQSAKTGQMDLEHALLNYLSMKEQTDKNQWNSRPYLAVIHRLDQPVEGILVFAKNPWAARELNRQLQNGTVEKDYLAVVSKIPEKSEECLTDYLLKDGRTNRSEVVSAGTPGAKKSVLQYRRVDTYIGDDKTERALLEIHLMTGRHHQIRVQLSHRGMPLVGDGKYGSADKGSRSLALCAYRLCFRHPCTGKKMEYKVNPEGEVFQLFHISL